MGRKVRELCPTLRDTREQTPWEFDPATTTTTPCTLHQADYSVAGLEDRVGLERKGLDDFVSSVTHERERFWRELERLQPYDVKAVIVEGTLKDIADHNYHSMAHPSSIVGSAVSITVDFGIPVIFCDNHRFAERYAEKILIRAWKKYREQGADNASDSGKDEQSGE